MLGNLLQNCLFSPKYLCIILDLLGTKFFLCSPTQQIRELNMCFQEQQYARGIIFNYIWRPVSKGKCQHWDKH